MFRLPVLGLAASLATFGCHAQKPAAAAAASPSGSPALTTPVIGQPLPLELQRRVEVLLRQKAGLPPGASIHVAAPATSEFPGFDTIAVTFSSLEGSTSHPVTLLLSTDGKTLVQMSRFDISRDPKALVSADDRPARGGSAAAPVYIVGFDDLECPYCARLHASIFPILTQRYGDKVRFVYRDFPLDQHPWAMRAAVDVNCVGAQSGPGYWNMVDYIHAHADTFGADPKAKPEPPKDGEPAQPARTIERANQQLDDLAREQGRFQKVDMTKLDACLAKQDATAIQASVKLGAGLGVESTPSLFINGDKIDGALPLDYLFNVIDEALKAEGVAPPAPYVAPVEKPAAAAAPATHSKS